MRLPISMPPLAQNDARGPRVSPVETTYSTAGPGVRQNSNSASAKAPTRVQSIRQAIAWRSAVSEPEVGDHVDHQTAAALRQVGGSVHMDPAVAGRRRRQAIDPVIRD